MRILIAAKHPPGGALKIGGVQSWCKTIGDELKARGHDVRYWGPGQPIPLGGSDLGIIANAGDTQRAFDWCRKSITVSHGIIPAEKPPAGRMVVFTSEEVRDHWKGAGDIIKQPLDLEFWQPEQAKKIYLTRFSYRNGLDFVPSVAQCMDLEYIHLKNSEPEQVRDVLRQSAVALCTGRAAVEAMAVGVPVVICDHRRGYMPPLMDIDTLGSAARNYSGRGGIEPNMLNVLKACRDAIKTGSLRQHVIDNHDAESIAQQLLENVV